MLAKNISGSLPDNNVKLFFAGVIKRNEQCLAAELQKQKAISTDSEKVKSNIELQSGWKTKPAGLLQKILSFPRMPVEDMNAVLCKYLAYLLLLTNFNLQKMFLNLNTM